MGWQKTTMDMQSNLIRNTLIKKGFLQITSQQNGYVQYSFPEKAKPYVISFTNGAKTAIVKSYKINYIGAGSPEFVSDKEVRVSFNPTYEGSPFSYPALDYDNSAQAPEFVVPSGVMATFRKIKGVWKLQNPQSVKLQLEALPLQKRKS